MGARGAAHRVLGRRPRCSPTHAPLAPSIFIVGDRKQSIYGFRDAEVALLDEASRYIGALAPDRTVRDGDHPELSIGARILVLHQRSVRVIDKAQRP